MQLSTVIVVFGLILELVEFNETYKIVKPYKYYNPHPRRPRWHPFPKSRKHYHQRRIPSKYHSYESDHHGRYAPSYEDSGDTHDDNKPYIIVIQVSQRKEKKKDYPNQKIIHLPKETDYVDDEDDELKVYDTDNKALRIKLTD